MFNTHPAASELSNMLKHKKSAVAAESAKPVLDAVEEAKAKEEKEDAVMDSASEYAMNDIAVKTAAVMQEFAETSDLDEGEGAADRLLALLVGVADDNMDGDIGEAEAGVLEAATECAWDYLESKGVSEDDISAVLNDWDNEAAARVQELLASRLPDGDEASAEDIDSFVFGASDADEAAMDAVYKKKVVIRKGKKVRINKRVSGRVRLSAKQKVGIRKALRKSHSAVAVMRRAKSMRIRRKMIG